MMRAMTVTLMMGAALSLAGCANDGGVFGSDAAQPTAAIAAPVARPAVDPACQSLAARIDALRKEGVVERVEAASKGKGATVSVKRASLAQVAELEKANADFQARCSTIPRPAAAAAAPAPVQQAAATKAATKAAAPAQKATAKAAAAKSGAGLAPAPQAAQPAAEPKE